MLGVVQLFSEYHLLYISNFGCDGCSILVELALRVPAAHFNKDLTYFLASLEDCWEVVCVVSGIVLLCSDPVFDEACCLAERTELVELLYEFEIWLLDFFL